MPRITLGRAELDTRPHILYRFYDRTGVLLYIGITVDLGVRMKDHAKDKPWWPQVDRAATRIEYYDGRRAALDAEREAIKAEKPLENDQHNEWVESNDEEDDSWSRKDFVDYLLAEAEDAERDAALASSAADWEGNARTVEAQRIEAAFSIMLRLRNDRIDAQNAMDDLINLSVQIDGGKKWRPFIREIRREREKRSGPVNHFQKQVGFLRAFSASMSAEYLSRLPDAEQAGWRECAKTMGSIAVVDVEIRAADYASAYKKQAWIMDGMCAGPDRSGARCPNRVSHITTFEVCGECDPGVPCSGHARWCETHTMQAQNGGFELLVDDPSAAFQVKEVVLIPQEKDQDPWEVPL
ncbi:GIY-YIG nuclease family protein [Actinoplanes sp. NPDC023936]|uniref:GIY-YIG nuclease family protein n=1 Tax=Actinoplanes sp. NPDC023936 TaxID=3154910 RepID=UPI0033D1977C